MKVVNLSPDALITEIWEGRSPDEWRARWFGNSRDGKNPQVITLKSVGSTNSIARSLAEGGAPSGTMVIADQQTAGRGRGGKEFHTPPAKALLVSFILRPGTPLDERAAPGTSPLRIGLATARAVDRIAGTSAGLKWPNDIQLNFRGEPAKIGGILCEAALTAAGGGFIIAGIGINVLQTIDELPPSIGQPATSIFLATGSRISRADLAGAISNEIRQIEDRLIEPFDDDELAELRDRDPLAGNPLTIDGEFAGLGLGVAPDGALLIRKNDGNHLHLRNGTVRIAPPTT